ncbi:hypothetical protein RF11_10534 [Thelohanellus kitauei]|uniref:Uncharacterized protein n=1 Tax=Thelohanellus kitauei TaxID=669202 RepID=A0A0C2M0Z0_THEKT|nr:hypothetical protein RF11_10534 [Thelohanellus kitauei]
MVPGVEGKRSRELKPDLLTKEINHEKWLFLFEQIAHDNGWDEPRQASIMPIYFRDDILDAYMVWPSKNEASSGSKLKKIKDLIIKTRIPDDLISSSFLKFQSSTLMPGQDVGQYVKSLKEWLRKARPEISDKVFEFYITRNILVKIELYVCKRCPIMDAISGKHKLLAVSNTFLGTISNI